MLFLIPSALLCLMLVYLFYDSLLLWCYSKFLLFYILFSSLSPLTFAFAPETSVTLSMDAVQIRNIPGLHSMLCCCSWGISTPVSHYNFNLTTRKWMNSSSVHHEQSPPSLHILWMPSQNQLYLYLYLSIYLSPHLYFPNAIPMWQFHGRP